MNFTNIAIVGAGPAGLAAAVEGASRGLSVTVLEKGDHIGGIRDGGIGPFGVESYLQHREMNDLTKEDAFNYMMDFTHWRTDARLVSEYINRSADTIAWLADLGVYFTSVGCYYVGAKATQHNFNFACDKPISQVLYEKALELDVKFLKNTPVNGLTVRGNRICGLSATNPDGTVLNIDADAVIMATGGFAGYDELVRECGYTPGKDLFITFDMSHLSGDGLKMMWSVGAAHAPIMMDTYIGLPDGYSGPKGTAPALAALRQPEILMVNAKGKRFFREDLVDNPGFTGNAVHRQKDGWALSIIDTAFADSYQKWASENARAIQGAPPLRPGEVPIEHEPAPFELIKGTVEEIITGAIADGSSNFYIADSIGELAEMAGIDPQALQETVDEYNAMCAKKKDPIFYKNPDYLVPVEGPRYIAARFYCDTYGGMGGVNINYKAEVLDENDDPIPGLYACGNDANTIYGDSYPFYLCGNTSGFCYNTGRIAAESAQEYIQGND